MPTALAALNLAFVKLSLAKPSRNIHKFHHTIRSSVFKVRGWKKYNFKLSYKVNRRKPFELSRNSARRITGEFSEEDSHEFAVFAFTFIKLITTNYLGNSP